MTSPLTYVREGLPPALTMHGATLPSVSYEHGVRSHESLERVDVASALHTVSAREHDGFDTAGTLELSMTIEPCLIQQGL